MLEGGRGRTSGVPLQVLAQEFGWQSHDTRWDTAIGKEKEEEKKKKKKEKKTGGYRDFSLPLLGSFSALSWLFHSNVLENRI